MSTDRLELGFPAESEHPRVLVVEDERVTRLLACESLELAGFRVSSAEDGVEALEAFERARPDIVLMDVKMPRMSGFEACETLRRMPEGSHTPVLMMTGLDDVESIERAYAVGATDFVNKPINWQLLGHRLEYMLRSSRYADRLRQSETRLAHAQRLAKLGYWEWHVEPDVVYLSDEMLQILGRSREDAPSTLEELLLSVHESDRERVESAFSRLLDEDGESELEYRIVRRDGSERHVRQQAEIARDAVGRPLRLSGATQDVTESRKAEERIRFLSYYDGLTGLPNRRTFIDRLQEAIGRAESREGLMAVLFVDLDRFNRINETLGHGAGDLLLKEVATRIASCLRSGDFVGRPRQAVPGGLVSRFGGDEFVILLGDLPDIQAAASVARRVSEAVGEPYRIGGQDVFLTTSIGITVYPWDGGSAENLLRNAESAMSRAKQMRGNSCKYYTDSMNSTALEQLIFEGQLRRAVDRQEFMLYYQPQVDVASGNVVGVEALLRWRHPELGVVEPSAFISVAEETGLIHEIGAWALRSACRQAESWKGTELESLRIAVNLSGRQFARADLIERIAEVLETEDVDPGRIEIELTESVLLQETGSDSIGLLEELKRLGVQLTVDDFGTGYSSLSYLSRLPLDALKIDQSFIRGLPSSRHSAAITRAIIAMAASLGLRVVAEGVETEAQLAFLRRERCDEFQGFLFARPLPAEAFTQILLAS